MKSKKFLLFLACAPFGSAFAAPVVWTGNGSSIWSAGTNWAGAAPPVAGDSLVFTQGSPANQPSSNDIVGLNISSLAFANSTFSAPLTLGGNAFTLTASASVGGASISRVAGNATATATLVAHGLSTGQFVTVTGAVTSNLNGTYPVTVTGADTFTYTSGASTAVAGESASYTLAALSDGNTTTSRTVTVGNPIVVSNAQNWATVNDVDAVTLLNGNLTGSGTITLVAGVASSSTNLPALRLGGNNSGYTGTISATATDVGILLAAPNSQTGGLVDLNADNRNLWLTTNTALTPYTFRTGNTTPSLGNPMNVNFRNNGTSGVYLADGDVFWNPTTTGNNYEWDASRAGSNSEIRINGSNDVSGTSATPVPEASIAQPRTLFFGNSSGSLVLGGNRSITNGAGANNPSRVTMNFALSDDGTARDITSSAALLILTRAAGGGGTPSLDGKTTLSGGTTVVSNMDQIFNGNLTLSGGVLLLNGISWAGFTADRSAGTGTGLNQWRTTGGGFASRGTPLVIDTTATTNTTFDTNLTLGSSVRADDRSLYANAPVTISQAIAISANRTITVAGGNQESTTNWTLNSPVHELSGAISGSFILNFAGTDRQNPRSGTIRLSNTGNSFSGLRVNSTNSSGAGGGGGVVVIATDDAAMGPGSPVYVGAGASGAAGLFLFENLGGGAKVFSKALQIDQGTDASSGDSGFGSWSGVVRYDGTATITGNRITLPVMVQAGSLSFGAGSSLTNNSSGSTQTYSKGGAGELIIDNNTSYSGTKLDLQWALRQGTITTSAAGKLVNGAAAFDGDNLIGNDGGT
ncbi:MAG: hypothetical protein ABI600_21385 [Luteolibacter sp.]